MACDEGYSAPDSWHHLHQRALEPSAPDTWRTSRGSARRNIRHLRSSCNDARPPSHLVRLRNSQISVRKSCQHQLPTYRISCNTPDKKNALELFEGIFMQTISTCQVGIDRMSIGISSSISKRVCRLLWNSLQGKYVPAEGVTAGHRSHWYVRAFGE